MEELNTEEVKEETDSVPENEVSNGWLVQIYSHFDHVPLKIIDGFIVICIIALITVVIVGTLKAKHII